MTAFLSLVMKRFSVRSYNSAPVEKEKIEYVMECVRRAPSAVNRQPWQFIVLETAEARQLVYPSYDREWFRTAPVVVVCCADHAASWHRRSDGKDHADIDVAIATEHLCLAAAEQGLGTCWVCNFDAPAVQKALSLPPTLEAVALIPMGYPSPTAAPTTDRRPLTDIVSYR